MVPKTKLWEFGHTNPVKLSSKTPYLIRLSGLYHSTLLALWTVIPCQSVEMWCVMLQEPFAAMAG